MGYKVKAFCFQDSPRRAHSIAAQGGINAAKNYQNDGDSFTVYFMIPLKVVIIELVKQTFIV
jgi:succinate dehydrogenase / fumarate reductase flavoprotein subunit